VKLKKFKPVTPGLRFPVLLVGPELSKARPERSLVKALKKSGGRNNRGRVTSRHRGGGHKRMYRVVDFRRNKFGVPGTVARLEYDPNRSCNIALINYADGEKRYILAPEGLQPGATIMSGPDAELQPGNTLPLANIPVGTQIHNIELKPGKGGQLARSAGAVVQLMSRDEKWAQVRLPSTEVRMVPVKCLATLGQVGCLQHESITLGKAGRNRWLGRRPHVRGVAMNPVDHPMGGGEGKSSGGRHPCSPWGQQSKGLKTRNRKKPSGRLIIRRRTKK
jgi:large subunit ribosomal protein L2